MRPNRRIQRDHSKPFFSNRRRGLTGLPLLLFVTFILGMSATLVLLTVLNYDRMQFAALELLGIAPPPTPFALDRFPISIRYSAVATRAVA